MGVCSPLTSVQNHKRVIMTRTRIVNTHPESHPSVLGKEVTFKEIVRGVSRNLRTVVDITSRIDLVFEDAVVFSGAFVSLIHPARGFTDIDMIISRRELTLDCNLKGKIELNGFEIVKTDEGRVHTIQDVRTGVKVEIENGSIRSAEGRVMKQEEICKLLRCKEDADTVLGFSRSRIIEDAVSIGIVIEDGSRWKIKVAHPFHQIALKYNLYRIRGGEHDLMDIRNIIESNYGSFKCFVSTSRGMIDQNVEFLGQSFERDLFGILH